MNCCENIVRSSLHFVLIKNLCGSPGDKLASPKVKTSALEGRGGKGQKKCICLRIRTAQARLSRPSASRLRSSPCLRRSCHASDGCSGDDGCWGWGGLAGVGGMKAATAEAGEGGGRGGRLKEAGERAGRGARELFESASFFFFRSFCRKFHGECR